jgi:predicted acylesterase/phospholipase RssA
MSPDNVPQKRFGEIALCLSGGGYRAATFALGTLDMLDELNLLDDVKLLSTVSGGTFTGLTYATWQSEGKTFGEFYNYFGNFLKTTNCIDKALNELYDTPSPSGSTDLSLIRSAAKAYSELLLGDKKFKQLMEAVNTQGRFKELIFNATEFRTGNSFRFRASFDPSVFIGSQIFAVPKEVAAEIYLADIVAASSCFPGAFEPIRFPDDFYWQSPLDAIRGELIKDVNNPLAKPPVYKNGFNVDGKCIALPLMDGGVFDNQGVTSAVTADRNHIFGLFLISDTSPRDNDILNIPDAKPRRGLVSLNTLFWLAFGLFILCLIGVGILTYLFFSNEPNDFTRLQLNLAYLVSVLPAFLLIGLLIWIYAQFRKFKSVNISGAEFELWYYFKRLSLPDAIEMVKARINSVLAMTTNIFMKRIRQLESNNIMNTDTARSKLVSFDLIYDLNPTKDRTDLWELDPELRPTDEMKSISECAEGVPTTLWMSVEEFQTLIACGRCTTCFSLLKYLWRRWQTEQEEAQAHKPPFEVPKPNTPESPYYEIYKILKAKWLELKQNPFNSQNRERV